MHDIIQWVIILAVTLVVIFILENTLFFVEKRVNLKQKGLKILHISDNHERNNPRYNRYITEAALREKPDLIVMTGDLVSRTETDFSRAEALLQQLCGIAPVYMCLGNHEQSLPDDKKEEFSAMIRQTPVHLLKNSAEYERIGERELYICGLLSEYSTYKKGDGYKGLDEIKLPDLTENLGDRPSRETLLLSHNPLFAEAYSEWGADYAFCGHTHGGAVKIGGIALLSPERKFFPRYSSRDHYTVGNMELFVSAGVGKLRLFNPPSISVYII